MLKKKLMNPAVLFSLLWFAILALHFIFRFTILNELFPLTLPTYLIFFIGALAFSFGSFIQTVIWQKNNSANKFDISSEIGNNNISLTLRYIGMAIIIVGLPFYIHAAYRVFLASNIDSFLTGLRTELTYGDEDIGPTKYLTSFSFVVFAINLFSFFKKKTTTNRILLVISFLITLTYAFFVTGRGLIFMLFTIYLGLSSLINEKFSIKKIAVLLSVFMVLFMAIGIIYGKGGDTENTVKENVHPATESIAVYLVSPLNALEWDMNHQYNINYSGENSLRFFIKIEEQLHLYPNIKAVGLVKPFVFVPYSTNVYTFYNPYIKDFGRVYAWIMIGFFGFFHTFLYYKALETKKLRYSLYYSFLLFPLLMSFFQDQYLSLFSQWLQIVIYIEGFIFLNNFFASKNDRYRHRKLE